jgi:hypothetical protein
MNLLVLMPLLLGCLALVIAIPMAAHKGKLHVPGYAGAALLAFAASILCGSASGHRSVVGSSLAVVLSLLCFWLAAAGVGSVLALFFYRNPAEI